MQLEMCPSDVNRFNPANSQVHINFPGQLGSMHRIKNEMQILLVIMIAPMRHQTI